jgi:hypothetical protein
MIGKAISLHFMATMFTNKIFYIFLKFFRHLLSGRRDSNPESPDPKSGMLAVTPRPVVSKQYITILNLTKARAL